MYDAREVWNEKLGCFERKVDPRLIEAGRLLTEQGNDALPEAVRSDAGFQHRALRAFEAAEGRRLWREHGRKQFMQRRRFS